MTIDEIIQNIKDGKIGIIPTDTLYGIVCSAFSKEAVSRIYDVKKRNTEKPFIILISDLDDLKKFNTHVDQNSMDFLMENWPGPISVIISVEGDKLEYLHRGKQSLVFRMPDDQRLIEIIKATGPLVAPSANPEGEEPAHTIEEAKKYFGNVVDFYYDGGELSGEPSTIVDIRNGKIDIIRQGKAKISNEE